MENEATIRKRFERASNEVLIEAIESGDYTALAEKIAQEELNWREFTDEELLVMVKEYWIKVITPIFKALVLKKSMPKSKSIDETAMRDVMRPRLRSMERTTRLVLDRCRKILASWLRLIEE